MQTTLSEARILLEGQQQTIDLQQQLAAQTRHANQLQEALTVCDKQVADQAAQIQEQAERWQQQQNQDQAWFARRITEEK